MNDNCPRCLTETEPEQPADDAAQHVCGTCGHHWTTSRIPDAWRAPEPEYATYDDPDAWEANDPPQAYDPRHDAYQAQAANPWAAAEQDTVTRILAAEPQHHITLTRLDAPDQPA
ncbi:hypothetical protein [Streptomyces chryseus]